jgi:peroxiredoxin Q/BCP
MIRSVAALALVASSAFFALAAPGAEPLEVGDEAPSFTLQGSDGRSYSLSQFVGERGVVLAWFPQAFTPG